MHIPLDIPLEQPATTRRADRRVVLLCIATCLGIFLGYLVTRLPFVAAETIGLQPKNTTASIRLLKTSANATIFQQQFGEILPLDGLPISLGELLRLSHREISIHSDTQGVTAIAIDRELPEDTRNILTLYGFHAWTGSGKSLITPADTDVQDTGYRIVVGAFLPWYDGEITTHEKREQRAPIFLRRHQLTIHGAGSPGSIARGSSIPKGSTVIFSSSMAENILDTLAITESTEALAPLAHFTSLLSTHGASVVLTQDAQGQGFFAAFPASTLTVEDAAAIGKDIANRQNLSTKLMESEDGESFEEIFANDDATTVDISAERDFTFITITSVHGDVLRLTKTPDILTISNRAITITDTFEPHSACLAHAHTWVTTQAFLDLARPEIEHRGILTQLFSRSSELAVSPTKTRICW